MNLQLRKVALMVLLASASVGAAHAASMAVHTSSFVDGRAIPAQFAGLGMACGDGQAVTPQIGWTDVPLGTRSMAVVLFDPDGAKGLGVVHWVAYNIDPARGQIKQGEAAKTMDGITIGKNVAGAAEYKGLCPPEGDNPHHYMLTVIATDLPPGSLPAGLDRNDLLAALKGHSLAGQTVSGNYGH
jgi:Raf kinase inhibitor-like YbhB/YbcL family protein